MTMLEKADAGVWQDLFTSIIEDADSNVLLLDDEFRVITLNPGFYWIFLETYGIELKRGSSILESMEAVNANLTHEWKERCMTAFSGTPIKVEDVFELDGRKYYWEIHFKSATRPDGTQIISVFSRDITVRKAYQRKLLENEANLRSIGGFVPIAERYTRWRFIGIFIYRRYQRFKICFVVCQRGGPYYPVRFCISFTAV